MIDKLDLEVPQSRRFRPDFARAWNGPENEKIFRKTTGGLYLVTADLRGIGIPARLSCGHKHHEKLGPKLEIIGAGDMPFSQWAGIHEEIFEGEAWEDAILRADLTADVKGVSVSDLGKMMTCKFKHTNQQEYGDTAHVTASYARFAAQSLYYGRKPRQTRIYDKTLHRLCVLLPAIHRGQRKRGETLSTFEDVYGYPPSHMVTRVERQMGARETSEAWGVGVLGEIPRLMKCDPFENLRFIRGDADGLELCELDGTQCMLIELLRERVDQDGLDQARAWIRGRFSKANTYRKFWRENEHLIVRANPAITREALAMEYRRTLAAQLAA